jgi:NADPH:quinone reductase-like Zn-dependent oxidoreductase
VVFPAIKEKKFKVLIQDIFPMSKVAEAHKMMDSNKNIGKILLENDLDLIN